MRDDIWRTTRYGVVRHHWDEPTHAVTPGVWRVRGFAQPRDSNAQVVRCAHFLDPAARDRTLAAWRLAAGVTHVTLEWADGRQVYTAVVRRHRNWTVVRRNLELAGTRDPALEPTVYAVLVEPEAQPATHVVYYRHTQAAACLARQKAWLADGLPARVLELRHDADAWRCLAYLELDLRLDAAASPVQPPK